MSGRIILVAVDVEKTGERLAAHKIISLGCVVGDLSGRVLEKLKINFQFTEPYMENNVLNYGDFEPRCWEEFWSKYPKSIELCKVNQKSDQSGWNEFAAWLDSLEKRYTDCKIKFITDNPSFDIASIDYALEKYCDRSPMRRATNGRYRSVKVSDDMFSMLPDDIQVDCAKQIAKHVVHDHDSCNDAHYHYLQYLCAAYKQFPI